MGSRGLHYLIHGLDFSITFFNAVFVYLPQHTAWNPLIQLLRKISNKKLQKYLLRYEDQYL